MAALCVSRGSQPTVSGQWRLGGLGRTLVVYGQAVDSDALLDLPYDLRRLIVVSDRLTERSEKVAQPSSVLDGAGTIGRLIANQPQAALLVLAGVVGWELARAVRRLQAAGCRARSFARSR